MINDEFHCTVLVRLVWKIWHLSVFDNKIQLFSRLTHSNSLLGWAGAQPQAVSSRQPLSDVLGK